MHFCHFEPKRSWSRSLMTINLVRAKGVSNSQGVYLRSAFGIWWYFKSKLIDIPFGRQIGLVFWHLFEFSFKYQLWNNFIWISDFWTNYRSVEKFFSVCVSIIYEALFTPLTSKSSDSLNLTYSEDCCKGEKIDFRSHEEEIGRL